MRIPALICLGGAPYPSPFGKNPYRTVPKTCDLFPASRPVISNKNPNISNKMKWAQNIKNAKGGKFHMSKKELKKIEELSSEIPIKREKAAKWIMKKGTENIINEIGCLFVRVDDMD